MPTYELVKVAGFGRPLAQLMNYRSPPEHLSGWAVPELFLARDGHSNDAYWSRLATTPGESSAYVGTVPLVLSWVGIVAAPRDRRFTPWRLIVPAGLALASMASWWPDGYWIVLQVPGFGLFRAPGRYTLLTSLGLSLLAGRGLDRTISARRFGIGLGLAILAGAASFGWSMLLASRTDYRASFGADTVTLRIASAAGAWAVGLGAVVAWRMRRLPDWAPVAVAALELSILFHLGSSRWQKSVDPTTDSPILARLATEPDVGLVAGPVGNVPVRLGLATAFPDFGITPPPPNYLLESARTPPGQNDPASLRWQRRFGVTHGVWHLGDETRNAEILIEAPDPALDRLLDERAGPPSRWKLARMAGAFPRARVATRSVEVEDWGAMYVRLTSRDDPEEVVYETADRPREAGGPRAKSARLIAFDGRSAEVEHDGECDLVVRRTYYPGWMFRIDGGPRRPSSRPTAGCRPSGWRGLAFITSHLCIGRREWVGRWGFRGFVLWLF